MICNRCGCELKNTLSWLYDNASFICNDCFYNISKKVKKVIKSAPAEDELTCARCGQTKPIKQFTRNIIKVYNARLCRPCAKEHRLQRARAYDKEWRARKREMAAA